MLPFFIPAGGDSCNSSSKKRASAEKFGDTYESAGIHAIAAPHSPAAAAIEACKCCSRDGKVFPLATIQEFIAFWLKSRKV